MLTKLVPNTMPDYQTTCELSQMGRVIEATLTEGKSQYRAFQWAQRRSNILGDYMVWRIIKVFTQQKELFSAFQAQLSRWRTQNLNALQMQKVANLEGQLNQLKALMTRILVLADDLEQGTIENFLGQSGLELDFDILWDIVLEET
ncbi:MAG: hypothetical protein F6K19_16050 [Cyanothece sp. SIO1E1]|nr:hypothetical protein [Cyanothece sp. SIO1E1]